MVDLLAKTACDGLAPLNIGTVCLREGPTVPMTTLAPYRGQQAALDAALQAAHGLGFPPIGGSCQSGDARALWFGRDLGLLMGIEPEATLAQYAALTDQSQGWAVMRLEGQGGEEVLARLCPVDLRLSAFGVGAALHTEARHMQASICRIEEDCFQIMVFRSMARTMYHDLKTAMEAWAARG
ncbi:sarcosine oxidase subunit gamma [Pseudophaeobacter sp.]|uniref:sarcosine oxidase subunit gamma n=1 Tax=Pseudophaeobacter sp. TaxID=1971739 RepID=UPI003A97D074